MKKTLTMVWLIFCVLLSYNLFGQLPNQASNPIPENNAQNISVNLTELTWSYFDEFGDYENPESFRVFIAAESDGFDEEPNAIIEFVDEQTDYTLDMPVTLQYETGYIWKVIPFNQDGEAEDIQVWSFTTEENPGITNFPWIESFEGEVFPPVGWQQGFSNGDSEWVRATGGDENNPPNAADGDYNALFFAGHNRGYSSYLITPQFDVSGINVPQLSYWHAQTDNWGDQDELKVFYKESHDGNWQLLSHYTNSITNWTERSHFLPSDSHNIWFKFEAIGDYGHGVVLDNITLQGSLIIPYPSDLTTTNIFEDRAELSWRENGTAELWDIELIETGLEPTGEPTVTGIAEKPYTYTELLPSTIYDFYVRADAGEDGVSDWSTPYTFKTAQTPVSLPYFEDFENDINWEYINENQTNQWFVGDAVSYQGEKSAYISNDNGVNNSYNIGSTSVVHIYRDIMFPEEVDRDFELSFNWKGNGEGDQFNNYDFMTVHIVSSDIIPTKGAILNVGQVGGNYNLQNEWVSEVIELEQEAYTGRIMRLVFSWQNDDIGGIQPPVAIDNILLREQPLPYPNIASNPVPTDQEQDVSINIEQLQWTYISDYGFVDPDSFRVYVSADENELGETIGIVRYSIGQDDYHIDITIELTYDTEYFWKVIPFNINTDTEEVPLWSFRTEINPLPLAVFNPTPQNEAYNVSVDIINLEWNFLSDISYTDPSSFKVYISETDSFADEPSAIIPFVEEQTEYYCEVPISLSYNRNYIWKVVPTNNNGETEDVAVWLFTTEINPNPNIATNPLPEDEATNIHLLIEYLGWSYIVDEDYINPEGFRVYFDETDEFGDEYIWVAFDESEQNYVAQLPNTLNYFTTYYWKVVPTTIDGSYERTNRNRREYSTLSLRGDAEDVPVWSFTTEIIPNPTVAVNPLPEDGAEEISIELAELSWSYIIDEDYTNPVGFRVYFGTDPESLELHGNFVYYEEEEENYSLSRAHAPHLAYSTTYYWKVVPTTNDPEAVRSSKRRSSSRTNSVNNVRGDAEDVPVWSFLTEEVPTSVEILEPELVTALHGNYPNPFNPNTTIKFSLKEDSNVILVIFNFKGQVIRTLHDGIINAGNHNINWNGKNNQNKEVSSGVYFYRLKTEHYEQINKMMLVK